MSKPTDLDRFIVLSRILTDEKKLDRKLAQQYFDRLNTQYAAGMQDLLKAFDAVMADKYAPFEVKRRIVELKDDKGNFKFLALVQQIISIWYTAEFVGSDGKPNPGTQEQYYSGLLWKVIRAHPPTYSTQSYGYWKKPPSSH